MNDYAELRTLAASPHTLPLLRPQLIEILAELDDLRDAHEGPWRLMRYDPEGDDNRGDSDEQGLYRSKERAEQLAAEGNARLLERINRDLKNEHDRTHGQTAIARAIQAAHEHNALLDAGLRSGERREIPNPVPVPFVPRTELHTFEHKPADSQRRRPEYHYYVEAVHCDD